MSRSKLELSRLHGGAKAWGIVYLLLINACGSTIASEKSLNLGCEVGTEGCDCYGNWSCNYQLSCVDEVCIDRNKLLEEEGQSLSKSALRVADPIASIASNECLECMEGSCVSPLAGCYDAASCPGLFSCLLGCSQLSVHMYGSCADECYSGAAIEVHAKATQLQMCAQSSCNDWCG